MCLFCITVRAFLPIVRYKDLSTPRQETQRRTTAVPRRAANRDRKHSYGNVNEKRTTAE